MRTKKYSPINGFNQSLKTRWKSTLDTVSSYDVSKFGNNKYSLRAKSREYGG